MSDLNFALQLAGPCAVVFAPPSPRLCVRESDQGIRLIVAVVDGDGLAENIRYASALTIKLLRPDGTSIDVPGLLFSNGADGKMYFLSSVSVPPFDEVGEWRVQGKVVIGGVAQSTKWSSFTVEPNIDAN